jgi:hypothetical protein
MRENCSGKREASSQRGAPKTAVYLLSQNLQSDDLQSDDLQSDTASYFPFSQSLSFEDRKRRLMQHAETRGLEVTREYNADWSEHSVSKNQESSTPVGAALEQREGESIWLPGLQTWPGSFANMLQDAESGEFEVLLFWSLDRLSPRALQTTMACLLQLGDIGVILKAYQEDGIDTRSPEARRTFFGLLTSLQNHHAQYQSAKTKAGMRHAKEKGKDVGRPSKFDQYRRSIVQMKEEGATLAEMKRETGLAHKTLKKYLSRIAEEAS